MTRTRWTVLALGLSLAANAFLATATWQARRAAAAAAPLTTSTTAGMLCCAEEKQLREQLAAQLCAQPPDRAAIQATFAALDSLRTRERGAALERFMDACASSAGVNDVTLNRHVRSSLCPWSQDDDGGCAPSSTPGSRHDNPAQPRQQGEKS
jgi:hypothetical protein